MGAFSATTGHTLPDRYIEGTCPICGYDEARGDQCDNCGNQLDPADLIDPRSKIDGSTPVFRETKHLFLDLPAFADQLPTWIESRRTGGRTCELLARARRRAEAAADHARPRLGRADPGARLRGARGQTDLRLVRRGDRLPLGGDRVGGEGGSPTPGASGGRTPTRGTTTSWARTTSSSTRVIWPAQLLGYGEGGEYGAGRGPLQLPAQHRRSEFLTMEGRQFSTSRGVASTSATSSAATTRTRSATSSSAAGPETQDTDFTWAEFVRRNNDELVANWGNLVNRTLTNAHRNFGEVPEPGELAEDDSACSRRSRPASATVGALIERGRFRAALGEAMRLASRGQPVRQRAGAVGAGQDDRDRAGDRPLRLPARVDSLKTPLHAVPAVQLAGAARAARLRGLSRRPARVPRGRRGRRPPHDVLTGDYATGSALAAERASAGPEAARAGAALQKLDPSRSSRTSSGGPAA